MPEEERRRRNAGWGAPGGGPPTLVGAVNTVTGTQTMEGLAYAAGSLYGWEMTGTPSGPEGLYEIDPATAASTLVARPSDGNVTIGGIDADPQTGVLYGTDDGANDALVTIGLDGTITPVAPYPNTAGGNNDFDGLAIGGGRAYLIIDNPGTIPVFDLGGMTYTAPISSPFGTSEVFAGGAWILAEPSIALTKTVGTQSGVCAAGSALSAQDTVDVQYCYRFRNTGQVTLTRHDLADSELGTLLSDFPFELGPEGEVTVFPPTTTITSTTVNTATWTAYNPGPTDVVTATDSATVEIVPLQPGIALTKTVGTQSGVCAASSALSVQGTADVQYCYRVRNTGEVTLTRHDLADSELGTLLGDFPLELGPEGEVTVFPPTTTITTTTVNTATWTAYNPGPTDVVSDTASATVEIAPYTLDLPAIMKEDDFPGN